MAKIERKRKYSFPCNSLLHLGDSEVTSLRKERVVDGRPALAAPTLSMSRSAIQRVPAPLTFNRPARFFSGMVVVDAATAGLARELVEFEKLGTISLKGKATQVEVYTPIGPAASSVRGMR